NYGGTIGSREVYPVQLSQPNRPTLGARKGTEPPPVARGTSSVRQLGYHPEHPRPAQWWAHLVGAVQDHRMNIDVITTSTSSRAAARRLCGVHTRHARIEGGRDEVDWVRFTCEPAIDCNVGSRHRRSDREDLQARRGGGLPRVLRLHSAAGCRRDRSDGLDGMVPPVDGGAGDSRKSAW